MRDENSVILAWVEHHECGLVDASIERQRPPRPAVECTDENPAQFQDILRLFQASVDKTTPLFAELTIKQACIRIAESDGRACVLGQGEFDGYRKVVRRQIPDVRRGRDRHIDREHDDVR